MGNSGDARRCASMPWKETSPVIERLQFIHDSQSVLYVMSELCERYDISRKTGFKGQFRTSNGLYCYPLTVADLHSRMLLGCDALLSTKGRDAIPCFKRLFQDNGLPAAIRTDNGVPFASNGLHGLSRLNVWWMRL